VNGAYACFASAAEMAPSHAQAWYMTGGMHVVSGQSEHAVPFFHRALEAQPDHAHALFELGNVHLARREASQAHDLFARSVVALERLAAADAPPYADTDVSLLPTALANLGNALNDLQRPSEALSAFERAAKALPPSCIAFNGLSNAYESAARYEEARLASARATRLLPSCDYAYYNLGRLLRSAERPREAQAAFKAARALKPAEALYANGLGTALHAGGQGAAAIAAYEAAVRLSPGWSSPYRNIGLVHYEAGGRAREALKWYERTVQLEPTSAETYCDMGTAYLELHEQRRSMLEYERALALEPTNSLAHANVVHLSTKHCAWRELEARHHRLRRLLASLLTKVAARAAQPMTPAPHLFLPPYHALAYERAQPDTLRRLAAAYAEHAAERSGAAAAPPQPHPPAHSLHWQQPTRPGSSATARHAAAGRRLTVGYLTTDFGNHPTTHLMASVFRIQRELGATRAICFARSDDRSEQRAKLQADCEEFVDLTGLEWRVAAQEIRSRHVAVLVDLNGHCGRPQFEVLSLRPAPVQISYMGHPGTSGASYVQYVLVDRASAPVSAAHHFSERLLSLHMWHATDYRFAHAFANLGPPAHGAVPSGPPLPWPADASRAELGLPDDGFIFATFNQLYKITPPFYAAWLNTLRRAAPSARLWLLHFPIEASTHLTHEAAGHGVRVSRLLSAPTADRSFHLARASLADLHLDTSPYNGHTTVGDTTWMGTPTLTLPGEMMQSRVARGYALNAGCPHLDAHSLKWYEEMAASLAARPHTMRRVRMCLAAHRWTSAAFDTRRWVAAFDAGARAMWEVARYGRAPMHVLLPARHVSGVG
jgi:protein O-GlcNAc transferase